MANTNTTYHATDDVKTELQTMYKIIMDGVHGTECNCILSKKNSVLEMVQANITLMLGVFKEMGERIKTHEMQKEKMWSDLRFLEREVRDCMSQMKKIDSD